MDVKAKSGPIGPDLQTNLNEFGGYGQISDIDKLTDHGRALGLLSAVTYGRVTKWISPKGSLFKLIIRFLSSNGVEVILTSTG